MKLKWWRGGGKTRERESRGRGEGEAREKGNESRGKCGKFQLQKTGRNLNFDFVIKIFQR